VTRVETLTDAAIGETRQALIHDDVPVMLHVTRWSDRGVRALWGETYAARIRTIDRVRRGAFVDLGIGDVSGFLRLDGAKTIAREALHEGAMVIVQVVREGARGKGPVVRIVRPGEDRAIGRIARSESDDALDAARPAAPDVAARLDAVVEAALERTAPIPGGGVLTIEPTSALVAIDVDAGARRGGGDAERFARELNIAAARAVALEARLRNLGGLLAVDFVSQRDKAGRDAVVAALREAVADDPWGVIVAPMSRFGVVEMSRGQLRAPLAERFLDKAGAPTPETVALRALRAMEREARAAHGRGVTARLAPEVAAWLESDAIAWRDALTRRIGSRWRILASAGARREHIDVALAE
jgi:Ribonuclease G/E